MADDRRLGFTLALGLLFLFGCGDDDASTASETDPPTSTSTATVTGATLVTDGSTDGETSSAPETDSEPGTTPETIERWVRVTLDGAPVEGAYVAQGGTGELFPTDSDGRALVVVDTGIAGELVLIAGHAEARTLGQFLYEPDDVDTEIVFELARYDTSDNLDYEFNEPGIPGDLGTTHECGHCHADLKEAWYSTAHRRSASNPAVQDIYAGVASALNDAASCEGAGGQWWEGVVPGTDQHAPRCYLGAGTLPDLNEGCGDQSACDDVATEFGGCADCHAPAIDGELGGRDLLAATGTSFDDGVHCDLCHKVASVEIDAPAGVGGRLKIVRPTESSPSPSLGPWLPLSFGPYYDVPNPRMGAVQRDLYLSAEFCAGCHQHDQAALVPGVSLDATRWPAARLPIHSTYEEWRAGPFFGNAPCSSCHMPADPDVGNGANLQVDDLEDQGPTAGWLRPPGAVRQHTWIGPRLPESGMLQLAAAVFIDSSVTDGTLTTQVTVRNVGAGHAIPTGEPLRSLVLFVAARCGDEALAATGGDAIPDFGGWLDRKVSAEDWSVWPGAAVGDVVRVVVDDGWIDYPGFGPFGDGSFDAQAKGLPRLRVVGEATITAVNGDQVSFDAPLPPGDLAFRGEPDYFAAGDPLAAGAVAGAPGFAFARVLADQDGARMVPHHRATDVVSDNRVLPQQEWTSTHAFTATCPSPVVTAALLHRAYPIALARERGWSDQQQLMVEVSK